MPTLDHTGLNRYIYMSSSIDGMSLGSTDLSKIKNLDSASFVGEPINDTRLLMGLNIYRNGPYGFSSWKQIRVSDNPLSRHLKKNNKFPILARPKIIEATSDSGQKKTFKQRYGDQLVFDEPMIVSNHKPLIFRVGDNYLEEGRAEKRKFDIVSAFNNNSEYFTNDKINEILGLREDIDKNYNIIKKYYLGNALGDRNTPLSSFETLFFSQGVYPPQQFTYKDYVRRRKNFNFYWNSEINNRHNSVFTADSSFATPYGKSNTYSGSYWPLDVDFRWESGLSGSKLIEQHGNQYSHVESQGNTVGSDVVFDKRNVQTSSYGVLWNTNTQFANHADKIGNLQSTSATRRRYLSSTFFANNPLYSRRHTLTSILTLQNPAGSLGRNSNPLPEDPLIPIPRQYIPQGAAFWDTPRQSGKAPFFDTYEEFADDISRFGKDHTLIPEFRISSHVPNMIKNGVNSFINNFLEIEGTTEEYNDSSKEEFFKIYSTSDFLKNFDIILEDHKDFVSPSTLTLRCKGIKKFLPYDGFYPVQRTVKLFQQFTSSYGDNISTDKEHFNTDFSSSREPGRQSLYSTIFAPGVLYNSIKSGVACDYPVITKDFKVETSGSGLAKEYVGNNYNEQDDDDIYIVNSHFDTRVPFEAIVDPQEYLASKKFIRNETHLSSSFLSSSCIWNGQGNKLYVKMSNNFISETVKFFIQGKDLTTIVSAKESSPNFGIASAGNVYGMRIKMFRSMTQPPIFLSSSSDIAYQAPQDILPNEDLGNESGTSVANFPRETITMYSRPTAFGPPSSGINKITGGEKNPEHFSNRSATHSIMGSRFGRNFPFTPPYYHGQAWADIEFTPTESKKHTLSEILAKSTVKYTRFEHKDYYDTITSGSGPQSFYQDAINRNAMQLSSSMNLFIAGRLPKEMGLANTSINDQADSRWIIQTKFETPILNFAKYAAPFNALNGTLKNKTDHGIEGITLPNHPGSASVPVGMWHQYGDIPENDEGVFIQVTDIPNSWVEGVLGQPTTSRKSLIDITGFNTRPKKIGQIASRKVVSEAVVAIPFISERGVKKFFRLDRNLVNNSIKDNPQDIPVTVYNQVQKMKKFIFPPQFDFVNFPEEVDPIAMYIFEFSMELSQQDLADIWQNVMPSQSLEFESSESSISHPLLEGELLNKESLRSNLRWMVFKVKQRAESSYQNITFKKSSPDDNMGELKLQNVLRPEGENDYIQYNWPYDFFSIVELAKIEAEVGFSNLKKDIETGQFVAEDIEPFEEPIVNGVDDQVIIPEEVGKLYTSHDPDEDRTPDGPTPYGGIIANLRDKGLIQREGSTDPTAVFADKGDTVGQGDRPEEQEFGPAEGPDTQLNQSGDGIN